MHLSFSHQRHKIYLLATKQTLFRSCESPRPPPPRRPTCHRKLFPLSVRGFGTWPNVTDSGIVKNERRPNTLKIYGSWGLVTVALLVFCPIHHLQAPTRSPSPPQRGYSGFISHKSLLCFLPSTTRTGRLSHFPPRATLGAASASTLAPTAGNYGRLGGVFLIHPLGPSQ